MCIEFITSDKTPQFPIGNNTQMTREYLNTIN